MIFIFARLLQLLLSTVCLGQVLQDSPVLHVVSPVRTPLVVCYLHSKTWERTGAGAFTAEDIDPKLCTHIIYAFGTFGYDQLLTEDTVDTEDTLRQYASTVALRDANPKLKILLSIGGKEVGSPPFQDVTTNISTIHQFAKDAIRYLRKYKFNGLDIAWKYPTGSDGKVRFANLLKYLRQSFNLEADRFRQPRLLLTTAVHGYMGFASSGYNVSEISRYSDFINLITYNFYGDSETEVANNEYVKKVGHNAPLTARKKASAVEKKLTLEDAARTWVKEGAPKEKLLIGIPFFGRSFTLTNPTKFDIGSPVSDNGRPGEYTGWYGTMAYFEICKFLREKNTTLVWDDEQKVPYAYKGNQWIGFDNERSVKSKVAWARKEGFGGISVWSVDMDDFGNQCGAGRFPLLNTIKKELDGYKVKLEYRGPFEATYHINKDREASDLKTVIASIYAPENKSPPICSDDKFRCKNGRCIDRIERCDGKADCLDSSDETYTLCKGFPCSAGNFRCKYGGCVQGSKRCDRIQDCVDGSDENALLCGNVTSSPDGCIAPLTIPGTQYISGFCDPSDASAICIAKSGSILSFGSRLHVRCSEGYSLIPGSSSTLTCTTNEEYSPFPPTTCQKTCPPLVNYPNVQTECKLTDYIRKGRPYYRDVPCHRPLVVGTKVTLSCPLHFKEQKKIVTCLKNGQWDIAPTMECEPVCGTKKSDLIDRIDGGTEANQTDFPWHAGIYWYEETGQYKYVCGGSLISQSIVLTAAHCGFLDAIPFPPNQMYVGLGKQKVEWEENGNKSQKLPVKEFIYLPEYIGADQSFNFDIAIIVLDKPVTFTDDVHPVCLNDVPKRFEDDYAIGQVPGWGATEKAATSDNLKVAQIPYLSRDKCHDSLKDARNEKILTHDKFCGGYLGTSGSKASTGDSGGGLVYRDNCLYYVVGIVSTTFPIETFRIGAYTNVSAYSDWIKPKMKLRPDLT